MASLSNSSSHSPFSSYNSFEQARINSFLNNMLQFDGNCTEVDDEMASAGKRFETFKTWPETSPMKPIDLINAGFYYTGSGDEVRCFSCDLQLKGWKFGDDPFDEHRKIRANCKFVIEYEREKLGVTCNPVPASDPPTGSVGGSRLEGHSRNPYFGSQSIISDPSYQTGYMQQQHYPVYNEPYQHSSSNLSNVTSSTGVFVTSQYPRRTRPVLQTPEQFTVRPSYLETQQPSTLSVNYTRVTPGYQESIEPTINPSTQQTAPNISTTLPSYSRMPLHYQESMQPLFAHGSVRNMDIPVLSPVLQHVPSVHVRTEDTHHTTSQTDLESIHHRLATFIDWPEDCPVKPWELAAAGFFYMGTGDNVRCYKCKVALRNWEPDDTPWAEHTRWSPDCPLVKEHEEHPRMPVEDQEQTTQRVQPTPVISNIPRLQEFANTFMQPLPSHETVTTAVAQSENQPCYEGRGNISSEENQQHIYTSSSENMVRPLNSNTPAAAGITKLQSSLSDSDLARVMEMGFTREDIKNAIATQTERTGSGFVRLHDLMQALLDDSRANSPPPLQGQITNPSESQQTTETQCSPTDPSQIQFATSHSFSFDTSNFGPKRSLRRSNSAPPNASSNTASSEPVRDLDSMQEERLICKICMDAEVGVVFIPCGHISCCPPCASGLDLCPMCRKPIQQVVRTFLS
ncbi:E3 ubiquitin-protein ligase XIAP [Exaiptasia diaphana]|uniref:RING-type domain-containing protein n=1 Tax=Exaiptasia diaphana TaxID=2652724 RepID=A0A913Y3N8_EXADI|nr:E3 ubiquitin-protein ligase XIAP [Exaiptasia diaphana]KXJ22789.1 Baculoviral IAP repeat-containing protein 3 [Exaiptasia diaphana]